MSVQILPFLHPFKHNDFVRGFCSKSLTISPRHTISNMISKEDRNKINYSGDVKFVHTCHNTPIEKLAQIINTQLKENGVLLCERCQKHIIEAISKSINNTDHDKGKLPVQTEAVNVEQWMKLIHRYAPEPIPSKVERNTNNEDIAPKYNYFGEKMSLQPFECEKTKVFDTKLVKDPPALKNSSPLKVDITIVERKSSTNEPQIKSSDQPLGENAKKVIPVGVGPLPDIPLQNFTLTDMLNKIREKNEKCCKEHGITIQDLEPALVAESEANVGKQPCLPPLGPPPVIQPIPQSTAPRYGPPICPKPIRKKSKSAHKNNPCKKCLNSHTCYCNCYGSTNLYESEANYQKNCYGPTNFYEGDTNSQRNCYGSTKLNEHKTNPQKRSYEYSLADEKYEQIYGKSVKAQPRTNQPYQPKSFVKHLLKVNCKNNKMNENETNHKSPPQVE